MSTQSVISIPIDDEQFKKFLALYDQHTESLKKLPGAWQNVNKAVAGNGVSLAELTAALLTQNELLNEADKARRADEKAERAAAAQKLKELKDQTAAEKRIAAEKEAADKKRQEATERWNRALADAEKRVATVTKNTAKTTIELAKWGFLAAGAATAAGLFGGLFGIDRLAGSASQISRGARGLGVNPAAQQAFGVNFGRYVDPNSMLSNTAEMQADMSRWGAFMAAGIGTGKVQSEDPEQLSQEVIRAAKRLWDQAGPNNHTLQYMQAHGLDQLLPGGLQDWKRIGGASREELDQAQADAQRDRGAFALDPKALKAWTEFTNQMHRAGVTMEDVLIGRLAPLAGPLTDLSAVFTDTLDHLLANHDLGHWIDQMAGGVERFAGYLDSPAFKEDLQGAEGQFHKFSKAMGELLAWTTNALTKLGVINPPEGDTGYHIDPSTLSAVPNSPQSTVPWYLDTPAHLFRQGLGHLGIHPGGADANGRLPGEPGFNPATVHTSNATGPGRFDPIISAWRGSATTVPMGQVAGLAAAAAGKWNVPFDFQQGIYANEGGLNPDGSPRISSAGAIGVGQLMPGTAVGLGVNPFDTAQNIEGSTHYMRQLLDMFHGDRLAAAAAYNWGPNGSHRAILEHYAASGDTDETGLPDETRRYLHALAQRLGLGNSHKAVDDALVRHGFKESSAAKRDPDSVSGGSGKSLTQALEKLAKRIVPSGTRIVIEDRTGGNAVVSAAALAYG